MSKRRRHRVPVEQKPPETPPEWIAVAIRKAGGGYEMAELRLTDGEVEATEVDRKRPNVLPMAVAFCNEALKRIGTWT